MKPTATEQRDWLQRFAKRIAALLGRRSLSTAIPFRRFPVHIAPNTDGWFVEIADLRLPAGDIAAVFLDDISGGDERLLWVGIFAAGIPRIRQMARVAAKQVGPYFTLNPRDFKTRRGNTYMRRPISRSRLGRPVLEIFDGGLKDFGVYLQSMAVFGKRLDPVLIAKSARFLEQTLVALDGFRFSASRTVHRDQPFHNRSVVVTAHVTARSSAQAIRAKARDRYTCRLCGDKPEDRYGAEGRACLEAHHVRALHAIARRHRRTTLRDLVTVCANCHRVLGKLSQDERTFGKLQRRFRRKTLAK